LTSDELFGRHSRRPIPWSGNRRGHDGWLAFFQAVGQHLDGVTFTEAMKPFAVQGDHVVFAGRYGGRVKATGRHIDSPLVHLWTLRSGKVVRCVEMSNTAIEVAACSPDAHCVAKSDEALRQQSDANSPSSGRPRKAGGPVQSSRPSFVADTSQRETASLLKSAVMSTPGAVADALYRDEVARAGP